MKYFFTLIIILLSFSCIRTNNKQKDSLDQSLSINKTLTFPLSGDFKIICKLNAEFASDSCFDNLVILKGEKAIYKAQNQNLFVIKEGSKPRLYSVGQSELILLQFDNRPDLNRTLALHFKNGILSTQDTIPEIDNSPLDLDNDSFIEFYGTMHLTDAFCLDCDSAFYNPSLVYKFTETGLRLDSINTIAINKKIWETFMDIKNKKRHSTLIP